MLRVVLVLSFSIGITGAWAADTHTVKLNGQTFTVPVGFSIELAAASTVVPRPITADFDEKGRLYVADSSGTNENVNGQLKNPTHRILRLESTKGDGIFDKATVFADKMMFPEGTMWLAGSLYVAAPPHIWKLTDTNDDGVADKREIWFDGQTLTGCANDLHGPYRGPDGYIYWCKGAFAKQEYKLPNGKKFTTRAAHIFRAKPDGTGLEPVMTGGMDNPVDVVFLPNGERFFTTTFLQHPAGGKRDGIIHAVHGAVYGKDHDPVYEHPWTAPTLMPPMTHLGAAAPSGLHRYESDQFGAAFADNLFACCFNMHKVTRHVLVPSGSTYVTKDSDFVVSDSLDFHPTDVLEDADGSLLIVDTGGWYKLCCPTSQLVKPDIVGGIYRVRKTGAHKNATRPSPKTLPKLYAIALYRDPAGLPEALSGLKDANLHTRRLAAEALGRIGDPKAVPAILEALADEKNDRVLEHSLTYALIEIGDAKETAKGLAHKSAIVRRQALIALEQIPGKALSADDGTRELASTDKALREAAWWVAVRHPEWADRLAGVLKTQLSTDKPDAEWIEHAAKLASAPAVRKLLGEIANKPAALSAMATSKLKVLPSEWVAGLGDALVESGPRAKAAFAVLRAVPPGPEGMAALSRRWSAPWKYKRSNELQLLGTLTLRPSGFDLTDDPGEAPVLRTLINSLAPVSERLLALDIVARAKPSDRVLVLVAKELPSSSPMERGRMIALFAQSTNANVGESLIEALGEDSIRPSLRVEDVKPILEKYPAEVRERAQKLYAKMAADRAGETAKLESLLKELPKGDIRRGQVVFHNPKAACITCHAMGYLGGKVGPDLTKIGGVRAERDLLEAIVFPNASFVRSYEPVKVTTLDGRSYTGILKKDAPDEVIVATTATDEVRIARADIDALTPSTVSVMPSGLDQQLSKQDLADLIAFLKASK